MRFHAPAVPAFSVLPATRFLLALHAENVYANNVHFYAEDVARLFVHVVEWNVENVGICFVGSARRFLAANCAKSHNYVKDVSLIVRSVQEKFVGNVAKYVKDAPAFFATFVPRYVPSATGNFQLIH